MVLSKRLSFGLIAVILSLLIIFGLPKTANADHNASHSAQQCTDNGGSWDDNRCNFSSGSGGNCSSSFLGLPAWYKYLELNGDCDIVGPTKGSSDQIDWPKAAGYIGIAAVEILLRIAALVAVAFVIIGGFKYITSQGEPENTKSARQTIQNGIIGLIIAMVASAAVAFIGNSLVG